MSWRRTDDPDLIVSPPYFIRRANGRYLLGRDLPRQTAECLGGFDSAADAKADCERIINEQAEAA